MIPASERGCEFCFADLNRARSKRVWLKTAAHSESLGLWLYLCSKCGSYWHVDVLNGRAFWTDEATKAYYLKQIEENP